jgi:hypothetical protein
MTNFRNDWLPASMAGGKYGKKILCHWECHIVALHVVVDFDQIHFVMQKLKIEPFLFSFDY